jgi:hypothetical protein
MRQNALPASKHSSLLLAVYVLRLSSCRFDKSATDFHIKNKRLRAKPAVALQRDSTSQYSTAVFKLDVPPTL